MPKVLPIVKFGHPILTEKANKVLDVFDPNVTRLVENMTLTFKKANGLGIAGPQVNEGRQVCIISARECTLYPDARLMKPTVIINPVILEKSIEMETDWESCLSIPGMYGLVPRHVWVRVAFTTLDGKRVRRIFRNFHARVFQHEFDHLNGILFTSYVNSKDLLTKKEFKERTMHERTKNHA